MHRYAATVAAGFIAAIGTVHADPLTTQGIGLASCEKLARDIDPAQGLNNAVNALLYYWVQGYMSAANIATLEGGSDYVDLSKYDEKMILPAIKDFCTKNPDKKTISLIDDILNKGDRIKANWTKGMVKWAAPAGAALADTMTADDIKWVNQCIADNKGEPGGTPAVVRAYCICMNNKMDDNETLSISQWEKSHPRERKACEKHAGWK